MPAASLVANALAIAGICNSASEGRRLVKGGGVKLDGNKVSDEKAVKLSLVSYREFAENSGDALEYAWRTISNFVNLCRLVREFSPDRR